MSLAGTVILSSVELAWSWNEVRNLVLVPGYLGRAGLSEKQPEQTTPMPGLCFQRESHNRECSNVWTSGTGQWGRLPWCSELPERGLEGSEYPSGKDLHSVTLIVNYLLPSSVLISGSPPRNFIPKTPASSAEWPCSGLISGLKLFLMGLFLADIPDLTSQVLLGLALTGIKIEKDFFHSNLCFLLFKGSSLSKWL